MYLQCNLFIPSKITIKCFNEVLYMIVQYLDEGHSDLETYCYEVCPTMYTVWSKGSFRPMQRTINKC